MPGEKKRGFYEACWGGNMQKDHPQKKDFILRLFLYGHETRC